MINEVKRMQQLAGLINEIKVKRPSTLQDIKKFYEEHIDQDGDGEDDDMPDWGGPDNLADTGPQEYLLEKFLDAYEGMLSKEDIILLWLYSFSNYLNGNINDEEELEAQIQELGYSDEDINYFVDTIKSDATST